MADQEEKKGKKPAKAEGEPKAVKAPKAAKAEGGKPEGEKGKKPAKGAGAEATDDDIEIDDEALDDAAFIEEQEEGDDDVADIIGDVENEEEA